MLKIPTDPRPSMWWMVLLLVPFAGALWFQVWGIPFFGWYQVLWIAGSALVTGLVCFKATARPRPLRQRHGVQDRG